MRLRNVPRKAGTPKRVISPVRPPPTRKEIRGRSRVVQAPSLVRKAQQATDSIIWEQWNFQRKLDLACSAMPVRHKRYKSRPHFLPKDPRRWNFKLKEEVKNELIDFVRRRYNESKRHPNHLARAWTSRNFVRPSIPTKIKYFTKDGHVKEECYQPIDPIRYQNQHHIHPPRAASPTQNTTISRQRVDQRSPSPSKLRYIRENNASTTASIPTTERFYIVRKKSPSPQKQQGPNRSYKRIQTAEVPRIYRAAATHVRKVRTPQQQQTKYPHNYAF